ncbi:EF-hand domain-containing protein [Mariniblastus fucicola]|uniref:EF-hand domain-containing protein n=1 Tax=Mariniblastus fucicola TaxID=980251 RepID=A0A5B9PFB8_9BACT|nr:EF-hand domain-containing protein [Mariniblastus fucicola]QEG23880.1 hypothetical protein MFFC18_37840 [Mariniblastus fucicola]
MKTFRIAAVLILCGLGCFISQSQAQENGQCERGSRGQRGNSTANSRGGFATQSGETTGTTASEGLGPEEVAQRMIANFDTDGDGALNLQELSTGMAALQQSMLQRRSEQNQASRRQNRGDSLQDTQTTAARTAGGSAAYRRGTSARRGR